MRDRHCAYVTLLCMLQTMAMQRVLAKFGIAEIVRTGKISLKRGDHLLEMGGWGDGVERRSKLEKLQRHLQEQQAQQAAAAEQQSHASRRGGMLAALQMVIKVLWSLNFLLMTFTLAAGEEACWLLCKWSSRFIPHRIFSS